jgi:hypothetical protein
MRNVFLSHAAFDSGLAIYFKNLLESTLTDIKVFCSSDPTDLPPGSKWQKEIHDQLQQADMLLLLATSRSLPRPWVWFECGTLWFTNKRIIPLCLGVARKDSLPTPLAELMALNLDDSNDLEILFSTLEGLTSNKRKELDFSTIIQSLEEKEKKIENRTSLQDAGWMGIPWGRDFLSYDGPIEGLKLIEDEYFQERMAEQLEAAGFMVRLGIEHRMSAHAEKGYRIVYLTDRKSWRRKIAKNKLILIAKPTSP